MEERDMPGHRFAVGQTVHLATKFGLSPRTAETYVITRLLPPRDELPQYRIRSEEERHERVTTEDLLEPVEQPITAAPTAVR
jgi:hypothetical protein